LELPAPPGTGPGHLGTVDEAASGGWRGFAGYWNVAMGQAYVAHPSTPSNLRGARWGLGAIEELLKFRSGLVSPNLPLLLGDGSLSETARRISGLQLRLVCLLPRWGMRHWTRTNDGNLSAWF
jgi:hypothetical protein